MPTGKRHAGRGLDGNARSHRARRCHRAASNPGRWQPVSPAQPDRLSCLLRDFRDPGVAGTDPSLGGPGSRCRRPRRTRMSKKKLRASEILEAALAFTWKANARKTQAELTAIYEDLTRHYRHRLTDVIGKENEERRRISPRTSRTFRTYFPRTASGWNGKPQSVCATKAASTTKPCGIGTRTGLARSWPRPRLRQAF